MNAKLRLTILLILLSLITSTVYAESGLSDQTLSGEAWRNELEEALLADDWATVERISADVPLDQLGSLALILNERYALENSPQIAPQAMTVEEQAQVEADLLAENLAMQEHDRLARATVRQRDTTEAPLLDHVPARAAAAILTVGDSCTYANLQAAVTAAATGDTIRVQGRTYTGTSATVNINGKSLTIIGGYNSTCTATNGSTTTLDAAGQADSVIEIEGPTAITVYIENFILTNGEDDADDGGGVQITGGTHNVTLNNVDVTENVSSSGGGVYMADGASLLLENNTNVINNTANGNGGGIYCVDGAIDIESRSAVGIAFFGSAGNTSAGFNGGGIYADNCDIDLDSTQGGYAVVVSNSATGAGGGIRAGNGSTIDMIGSQAWINVNSARTGGGVHLSGGSTLFADNSAQVNSNEATGGSGNGGGIAAFGTGTIADLDSQAVLSSNSAGQFGGAAYVADGAELDLEVMRVQNNVSGSYGSVVYAVDVATIVELDSVLVSGGEALDGVVYKNSADVSINNTTITDVEFNGSVNGGNNSYVLINNGGDLTMDSSIVWGNINVSGNAAATYIYTIPTINCSILETLQNPFGSGNESVDPLFVNAAGNDFHIRADSPAVDKCTTGFSLDFEGENRPNDRPNIDNGGTYDAGADETYITVGINGAICDYQTIQSAIDAAVDGDTIYIAPDEYNETLDIIDKDLTLTQATTDCTTENQFATYQNVVIDANDATRTNGGVLFVGGDADVDIVNLWMRDGTASFGGVLYVDSNASVTLNSMVVDAGSASGSGGNIRVRGRVDQINDTWVIRGTTTGSGVGGGYAVNSTGLVYVESGADVGLSGFSNSSATNGGGFYVFGGSVYVSEGAIIAYNTAADNGGGIFTESGGFVQVDDSFIRQNTATNGGGVYTSGSIVSLRSTQTENNTATNRGGGIYATEGGSVSVLVQQGTACDFTNLPLNEFCSEMRDNSAGNEGGAVFLDNSTFSATETAFYTNSGDFGSGVYSLNPNDFVALTSVLFADNMTNTGAWTLRFFDAGSAELNGVTFAGGNSGAIGIADGQASFTANNTISWGNGGNNFIAPTVLGSCNISDDGSLGGLVTDPQLYTADSAYKYSIDSSSAARDQCNSGPARDVLLNGRPAGALYDIGAFEFGAVPTAVGMAVSSAESSSSTTILIAAIFLTIASLLSLLIFKKRFDSAD